MKNLLLRFFLKEVVILGLYAFYAVSLLVTSCVYYRQLHWEPQDDKATGNQNTLRTFDVDTIEKITNFTSRLFRTYFPEDEDAWRICSILGIGFGVFNIVVVLFNTIIIYIIYAELKKQSKVHVSETFDTKGLNSGTETCAKIFFMTSFILTLIFSAFSGLALLVTGGLGGKYRIYDQRLTEEIFWSARAFFGTVAVPGFVLIVFVILWLFHSFCMGISCAWNTSETDVIGRTEILNYVKRSQINNKPIKKDTETTNGQDHSDRQEPRVNNQ